MISPDVISRVKERTDIVALIGESMRLVRRGRSLVGLCPFHQEKTPSFHVNPERGFFHCFGCKESGGAVDFLMKSEGYTFPDAIRVLAERAGIEVAEDKTEDERRAAMAAKRDRDDLYAVGSAAALFYERSLVGPAQHPLAFLARAELERRCLPMPGDGNATAAFRIGYAPAAWDALAVYLRRQGISLESAERVGLLVRRSNGVGYYDRFRHRLMFPVIDALGRVVAFSGRALREPTPVEIAGAGVAPMGIAGDAPAKYINSPESPIYTKGEHLFGLHQGRVAIRQQGEAVLVEGNFDVVSLHARGVTTAVAPLGTAFTIEQARLLKRFAPSVVVMFDGDAAGQKAANAAHAPCREAGLSAKVATLPTGTDPDDMARKGGAKAIGARVSAARGMLEYRIDVELVGFAGAALTEQAARVQHVLALLREEQDPTLRGLAKTYADQIATTLLVSARAPRDLRQLENDVAAALAGPKTGPRSGGAARPEPVTNARVRAILGALVDHPRLLADATVQDALGSLEGDTALAVATVARYRADMASAVAAMPASVRAFVAGRIASPGPETESQARRVVLDNAAACARHNHKAEAGAAVAEEQDEDARLCKLHALMMRRRDAA